MAAAGPPSFAGLDAIPLRGLTGERATVVLFGDSLTQRGWGEDGWAAAVAHAAQRTADVFNRGFGGYNTRWARWLIPYIFPLGADDTAAPGPKHLLVTVWFGANDAALPSESPHVPLAEFTENLRTIVAHVQKVALHVVVLTPPPVHWYGI